MYWFEINYLAALTHNVNHIAPFSAKLFQGFFMLYSSAFVCLFHLFSQIRAREITGKEHKNEQIFVEQLREKYVIGSSFGRISPSVSISHRFK